MTGCHKAPDATQVLQDLNVGESRGVLDTSQANEVVGNCLSLHASCTHPDMGVSCARTHEDAC